jgi:hypothetical protein
VLSTGHQKECLLRHDIDGAARDQQQDRGRRNNRMASDLNTLITDTSGNSSSDCGLGQGCGGVEAANGFVGRDKKTVAAAGEDKKQKYREVIH